MECSGIMEKEMIIKWQYFQNQFTDGSSTPGLNGLSKITETFSGSTKNRSLFLDLFHLDDLRLWLSKYSLNQTSSALCWPVKFQWRDVSSAVFLLALSVLAAFRQKLGCPVKPRDAIWDLPNISGVSFFMWKKPSVAKAKCSFSFIFTVRQRRRKF